MIRTAGHLANASGKPLAVPDSLPAVEDLDWTVLKENVQQQGADPDRFLSSLAQGLEGGVPKDRGDLLTLVSVAGWRAGALALREDALSRAGALTNTSVRAAATRVLGIDTGTDLDTFLEKQALDRYWWPDRERHDGYVGTFGGFAGLGGPWISPPTKSRPLAEAGSFGILTGEDWWRADLDVWGVRLTPLHTEPKKNTKANKLVSLELKKDSYLAWLHVESSP